MVCDITNVNCHITIHVCDMETIISPLFYNSS